MVFLVAESMDDKLSWMVVLNTATECQAEPNEKFEKKRKSVKQRLSRRVSIWGATTSNELWSSDWQLYFIESFKMQEQRWIEVLFLTHTVHMQSSMIF